MLFLFLLVLVFGLFLFYNRSAASGRDDLMGRLEHFTLSEAVGERESGVSDREDLFDNLDKRIAKTSLSVRIGQDLIKADLPLRVSEYMAFRFTLASGLALLGFLLMSGLGGALGGVVGWMIMPWVVKRKQKQRQKRFAEQLEGCLTLISNSLKAGYSFLQALDLVAKEQPAPAGVEFGRVIRETTLGRDLDDSLQRLGERMESRDFDFVITAVVIQRQTGGNLAEILDSIAHTIRERIKLEGQIMTLTAMGRMSGGFISSLPFFLGLMFYFINRQTMMLLFTTWGGRGVILAAFLMLGMGMFAIKKVITIEV